MATQPSHAIHLVTPRPPDPAAGEERLVREAILMVATTSTPRVLVAGMAHGETVLDRLRRVALENGVRLLARPTARGDRLDVVVEPIC
jgi:hypothetical protein